MGVNRRLIQWRDDPPTVPEFKILVGEGDELPFWVEFCARDRRVALFIVRLEGGELVMPEPLGTVDDFAWVRKTRWAPASISPAPWP